MRDENEGSRGGNKKSEALRIERLNKGLCTKCGSKLIVGMYSTNFQKTALPSEERFAFRSPSGRRNLRLQRICFVT